MPEKKNIRFLLFLIFMYYAAPYITAQTTIVIEKTMTPPAWALFEFELLKANADAATEFANKYLDDRGYLQCVENWGGNDGPDDAMENFQNWTLLYALGAPESVLDLYKKAWEGHLKQYTNARIPEIDLVKDGMYYKEFVTSFDWEHTGECLQAFYLYGLCDPADPQYIQRLRRYAGFYLNEDPGAQNYDPQHKIIRSLFNGSRGPKLTPASKNDWGGRSRPDRPELLNRYYRAQNIKGDHPLNLGSAALAFNAFAITHENKYRNWLLEYVGAWKERVKANDGNIPANIGLNGEIGGEWNNKWYRGVFGWNDTVMVKNAQGKPVSFSRNYVLRGPRIAFGAAFILTGDEGCLEPLQSQINNVYAVKQVKGDEVLLPKYYGDNGWFGFTADKREYLKIQYDLYFWTMKQAELERLPKNKWIDFLEGKNPDYPEKALQDELETVRQKVKGLREDTSTPDTRRSDTPQKYNPVSIKSLVNLTLGANYPDHNGNILHSRLRYFDPVKQRAGLPEDVAVLVEKIDPESIDLCLVNVNQVFSRKLVVQMGAYAEHQCLNAVIGGRTIPINSAHFNVLLLPGAGEKIKINMKRYANQPVLEFPWDQNYKIIR